MEAQRHACLRFPIVQFSERQGCGDGKPVSIAWVWRRREVDFKENDGTFCKTAMLTTIPPTPIRWICSHSKL